MDYLEAYPWMNYAGSAIKASLGFTAKKSIADATHEAAKKAALGVSDNVINRVSSKLSGNLVKQLQFKHGLNYLKNTVKNIGKTAALEGIEEGQQHLLQERY
ncbi:hypothetical protein [Sharpea azabuensis]|uniref:hypothetical protein n=1 Tax=Sharpea azabuensis TaxID=322505 RepID=UPI0015699A55|nr:hypothetical protein [Sharpea azabuensis]